MVMGSFISEYYADSGHTLMILSLSSRLVFVLVSAKVAQGVSAADLSLASALGHAHNDPKTLTGSVLHTE